MSALVRLPGGRLAVRDGNVLLTVPALHPATPRETRAKVLELVLRRLFGEAHDLARDTADELARHSAPRAQLAVMMQETPHHTPRAVAA